MSVAEKMDEKTVTYVNQSAEVPGSINNNKIVGLFLNGRGDLI